MLQQVRYPATPLYRYTGRQLNMGGVLEASTVSSQRVCRLCIAYPDNPACNSLKFVEPIRILSKFYFSDAFYKNVACGASMLTVYKHFSQCTASNFSGAKAGDRRRATAADRYKRRSIGQSGRSQGEH